MNMINLRRELFHVPLSRIEAVATGLGVQVQLTHAAEARQFRESLVKRGLSPDTIRRKDELAQQAKRGTGGSLRSRSDYDCTSLWLPPEWSVPMP